MDNKTIVEYPKVCPVVHMEKCVYDTQGKVSCNGPITQGALKEDSIKKTTTDPNTLLFHRFIDERFSWK